MPKVQQRSSPFEKIKAPSTARLNGDRLTDELFHLERTIARGELRQQDITDSLDDLEKSVNNQTESTDSLKESVDKLTEMLAGACQLVHRILEEKENA